MTPFQSLVAIVLFVEMDRMLPAMPELVRMIVGSSVKGTRYELLPHAFAWGQVISA